MKTTDENSCRKIPEIKKINTKKRLNKKQSNFLKEFFENVERYPNTKQLNDLSKQLNLTIKFLKTWFADKRKLDNLNKSVNKRYQVNCKLNENQKEALNELFRKNPNANVDEMKELATLQRLDYGAVSRWFNIKRISNSYPVSNDLELEVEKN